MEPQMNADSIINNQSSIINGKNRLSRITFSLPAAQALPIILPRERPQMKLRGMRIAALHGPDRRGEAQMIVVPIEIGGRRINREKIK
jgi:hypothetical protein